MSALPAQADVLIVGAGPAGLTLAASLTQLGVDHVLIDRNDAVQPGTKAAGMQPATLEYLDRLGVGGDLIASGKRGHEFRVCDGQRTLLDVPYDGLDTPFPYLLLISQQATEEHLARHLAEQGGTIHRGHRLLTFAPDFPGVTATIAASDGTLRAAHARYLIGCDGVHSRVRATAGIAFPGGARGELFGLADVRLEHGARNIEDDRATLFFSPQGMLFTVPLPGGLFRVGTSVPPGSLPPTAAEVQALLDTRGPGGSYRVAEVVASSTYHVQERVADRMSDGPVFLAGDAAHTHSPVGAQGMNTGIQDAANLAWKIHDVLTGAAPKPLLDTYQRERHPVAARLVTFTSQITSMVMTGDPALAKVRNDIITAAGAAPAATGWLAARLAQLDISYADDTTARADEPYQVGQRVPPTRIAPAGLSWTLALPGKTAGRSGDSQLGSLAVRAVDGLDTTLLVRPDGYLAACGVPADPQAVLTRLGDFAQGRRSPTTVPTELAGHSPV